MEELSVVRTLSRAGKIVVLYLSVEQLHWLHGLQLEHYGGGLGLRDRGALGEAAARPAMTFGGEDL